jgi:hypothetical protein
MGPGADRNRSAFANSVAGYTSEQAQDVESRRPRRDFQWTLHRTCSLRISETGYVF